MNTDSLQGVVLSCQSYSTDNVAELVMLNLQVYTKLGLCIGKSLDLND